LPGYPTILTNIRGIGGCLGSTAGRIHRKKHWKKGVRIIQNIPSAQAGWGDQQKQKG
jgi:hypothetical protein